MIEIENRKYCPNCNPMLENEDKIIAESRKDLGRILYMLEENSTLEQIEKEILKERNNIMEMSTEELEIHIDEWDKLYTELQKQSKTVKTKLIAGLEVKRNRGIKASPKKKEVNVDDSIKDLINTILKSSVPTSTLKNEEQK